MNLLGKNQYFSRPFTDDFHWLKKPTITHEEATNGNRLEYISLRFHAEKKLAKKQSEAKCFFCFVLFVCLFFFFFCFLFFVFLFFFFVCLFSTDGITDVGLSGSAIIFGDFVREEKSPV